MSSSESESEEFYDAKDNITFENLSIPNPIITLNSFVEVMSEDESQEENYELENKMNLKKVEEMNLRKKKLESLIYNIDSGVNNIQEPLNSNHKLLKNISDSNITDCEQLRIIIQEPDIVQSTKSSSIPRNNQIPTAPPRKKKIKSADVTNLIDKFSEDIITTSTIKNQQVISEKLGIRDNETIHQIVNLVILSNQMEISGFHLPKMEDGKTVPVLDLSSAIKGDRVVSIMELDSLPNVTTDETIRRTFSLPNCINQMPGLTTSTSNTLKSPSVNSASNEKKDHENINHNISLNINRQRASTGSRTDKEQEFVMNLDTGENIPLKSAEEKVPKCINPLALHIMRRTKEYSSDSYLHKNASDEENVKETIFETKKPKTNKQTGKKRLKIRKFIGKTVHKIKSVAVQHGETESGGEDDYFIDDRKTIKVKNSSSHKGPYDFDLLVPVQEIGNKLGAVWTMKFSHCGRLLATGGQDNVLSIWILKEAFSFFNELRQKYNDVQKKNATSSEQLNTNKNEDFSEEEEHMPFHKKPFCTYRGHTADVLDVSWSKNYFLLSSSMDKTVRLWHISRRECLCCFQHIDFVTSISFHPKDDRYFLSGSLDGKLRLWNIPDKKVALWNEVSSATKLITAVNFCLNGRFAVVGTYDGRCIFYSSEQLKYFTQIHVKSTRGRNSIGRKITGIEPLVGEDKILVTSNDSRIRLYDLRDLTLTCKYKGVINKSSQIKASFSHNGKYIICGSEDHFVYIWKTQHDLYKHSSTRRDRNDFWEGVKAHNAVITNAIFAPHPQLIIKRQFEYIDFDEKENNTELQGEVLVSSDYNGSIRIFINKFKPV